MPANNKQQLLEQLLVVLNDLQKRIKSPDGTSDSNPSEMYVYFCENSSAGENCSYAQKAITLFEKRDYEDVKRLVLEAAEIFKRCSTP